MCVFFVVVISSFTTFSIISSITSFTTSVVSVMAFALTSFMAVSRFSPTPLLVFSIFIVLENACVSLDCVSPVRVNFSLIPSRFPSFAVMQ